MRKMQEAVVALRNEFCYVLAWSRPTTKFFSGAASEDGSLSRGLMRRHHRNCSISGPLRDCTRHIQANFVAEAGTPSGLHMVHAPVPEGSRLASTTGLYILWHASSQPLCSLHGCCRVQGLPRSERLLLLRWRGIPFFR